MTDPEDILEWLRQQMPTTEEWQRAAEASDGAFVAKFMYAMHWDPIKDQFVLSDNTNAYLKDKIGQICVFLFKGKELLSFHLINASKNE